MNILALDLSLTAAGWALADRSGVLFPPKGHDRGMARLRYLRSNVLTLAAGADLVVIEGYAFGVQGQQGHISLGELGGVIRLALFDLGKPVVEIPPACVKLFATGKGNAKKDEVLAAAIRKLGYTGHDHNEADALWLHAMARASYDSFGATLTEAQARALSKIAWPKIATAVAA